MSRPLADLIPPDRRRSKTFLLVLGGMAAGAMIFGGVHAWRHRAPDVPAPNITIRAFQLSTERRDVTSARSGSISPDSVDDWAFDLVVEGAVSDVVLAHCDEGGRSIGHRWGTTDRNPSAPDGGADSNQVWQLAVHADHLPSNPHGPLTPLAPGYHHLALYASARSLYLPWGDVAEPRGYVRAYVIDPNGEVVASKPVHVPFAQWPHPANTPVPPLVTTDTAAR